MAKKDFICRNGLCFCTFYLEQLKNGKTQNDWILTKSYHLAILMIEKKKNCITALRRIKY